MKKLTCTILAAFVLGLVPFAQGAATRDSHGAQLLQAGAKPAASATGKHHQKKHRKKHKKQKQARKNSARKSKAVKQVRS